MAGKNSCICIDAQLLQEDFSINRSMLGTTLVKANIGYIMLGDLTYSDFWELFSANASFVLFLL